MLWLAGSRGFDTLSSPPLARGRSYGLPGVAASIHCWSTATLRSSGYGLPGVAASIHWQSGQVVSPSAMACRESRLRYTKLYASPSSVSLWLAGSRGFDTLPESAGALRGGLWLAGSRGFDTLHGSHTRHVPELWLAGSRGFDTLCSATSSTSTVLWLAGSRGFDTLGDR